MWVVAARETVDHAAHAGSYYARVCRGQLL